MDISYILSFISTAGAVISVFGACFVFFVARDLERQIQDAKDSGASGTTAKTQGLGGTGAWQPK